MEIETFTKSQDCSATEFSNALVVKSNLKLVKTVCFAYTCKDKEIQQRRSRIRFLFFYSLKDVIASVNSLYEVQIIDVAVLYENTHLKHFVFGAPTGPAKVTRVHCHSCPGLPVLVS